MKKMRIGKSIRDVISEEEYIRRLKLGNDMNSVLSEDTAVEKDGHVFPVTKQYSPDIVGVTNVGPVILYSKAEEFINEPDYDAKNIIDFENVENLKDSIEKHAKLMEAERTILVSPDNIFTPIIKEEDKPEMRLMKQAVIRKNINLDNYKGRFGPNYNNDKRLFEQNSITFLKMTNLCNVLDLKFSITLEDKKGAPNPMGCKLTAYITGGEDE